MGIVRHVACLVELELNRFGAGEREVRHDLDRRTRHALRRGHHEAGRVACVDARGEGPRRGCQGSEEQHRYERDARPRAGRERSGSSGRAWDKSSCVPLGRSSLPVVSECGDRRDRRGHRHGRYGTDGPCRASVARRRSRRPVRCPPSTGGSVMSATSIADRSMAAIPRPELKLAGKTCIALLIAPWRRRPGGWHRAARGAGRQRHALRRGDC